MAAATAALCLTAVARAAPGKHFGTWLNSEGKGKLELRECGEESLCSEIVWMQDPLDENGKPWRDLLNPDPKQRGRQVLGIDVLMGTKKIAPNTWQGHIYDPEVGKVYYLKHLKIGQDKVEIRGCLSSGWPCRTKYWTRTKPLAKNTPQVQAAKPKPKQQQAPKPEPKPQQQAAKPKPEPQAAARQPATSPPAPQRAMKPQPVPAPIPQRQAAVPPSEPPPAAQPRGIAPAQPHPPQAQPRAPQAKQPAASRPTSPDVTASLPPETRTGGYMVQVAARQSHEEALQAYGDLQRQYPQLLGRFKPEVRQADLGNRGVWFRVGIGPVTQQSAAFDFCQRLKAAGADCIVRRR